MIRLAAASPELFFAGTADDPRLGSRVVAELEIPSVEAGASAGAAPITAALVGIADDRGIANGGGRPGARLGPTELRRFLYKLTTGPRDELLRLRLVDLGDATPGAPDQRQPGELSPGERSIGDVHALAAGAVRAAISAGAAVIAVGGGHDTAFGSHAGLFEALGDKGVVSAINVDAHLDLRPLREGRITSGTPFRRLLETYGRRYRLCEVGIQPQHNARAHLAFARENGVRVLELAAMRKQGRAAERFAEELRRARRGSEAIAVSLCLDAVEAASAPGVSAPCADGFTPGELYAFARLAGRERKVRLLDVMELSPPLDVDGRTARLAAGCVWNFLAGLCERRA